MKKRNGEIRRERDRRKRERGKFEQETFCFLSREDPQLILMIIKNIITMLNDFIRTLSSYCLTTSIKELNETHTHTQINSIR